MIEDLLAPLAPREPTDAEIARLLARADARRRRRRIRVATGAALATAAATALFAALPGDDEAPLTAGSLLQTTAAVAADQPGPPAWTGFRYIQQVWRTEHGDATIERTEEQWTDSRWQGRRSSPEAKVVAGALPPAGPVPELPADVQREIDRRPAQLSDKARAAIRAQFAHVDPKYLLGARDAPDPARHAQPLRRRRAGQGPAERAADRPEGARDAAARGPRGRPLDAARRLEPAARPRSSTTCSGTSSRC